MKEKGEIVFLGMFDLTCLDRARAVRIHNLYTALQELASVTLLSGDRMHRRQAVVRYLLQGGLRRARAVYVEVSTSTATEIDLCFLALVRAAGIPLIVFVPDAYQLFPELYPRVGWKVRLLDWGWQVSIATYLRLADLLLFPSFALAACFGAKQPVDILPPAGLPARKYTFPSQRTPSVVYIGAVSYHNGADLLLDAMEQVNVQYPSVHCHLITGETDAQILTEHSARHAPWLTVEHHAFDELPTLMPTASLFAIPRRINPYNDLAMPVKTFDYMSFGRPLVVTACREMAAFVTEVEAGLVVQDTVDDLAQGIMHLLRDRDLATRLGHNGYQAIQTAHSWPHRATRLLQMIESLEKK